MEKEKSPLDLAMEELSKIDTSRLYAADKLAPEHLAAAEEIIKKHKFKKPRNKYSYGCNNCFDRGYIGYTPKGEFVLCPKCISRAEVYIDWLQYIKGVLEK